MCILLFIETRNMYTFWIGDTPLRVSHVGLPTCSERERKDWSLVWMELLLGMSLQLSSEWANPRDDLQSMWATIHYCRTLLICGDVGLKIAWLKHTKACPSNRSVGLKREESMKGNGPEIFFSCCWIKLYDKGSSKKVLKKYLRII